MARVTGIDSLRINVGQISASVREQVYDAVRLSADQIAETMTDSIKAGAISGPGHVPSAPGQPPNADTHELDRGIVVQDDEPNLRSVVLSKAPYSADLEYGTRKMRARPFARPAVLNNIPKTIANITGAVSKGIKT